MAVKYKMCYITFLSQTAAYRLKKMAIENGFSVNIVQTPKEISYGGCSYAARCDCETATRLSLMCKRKGISYSRIFQEKKDINGRRKYVEI